MALEGLLQALGAVGNVLDTPGSIARGLAAAPFSGEWDRPFAGILDHSKRVYGSEWTGDPWSGMAVDMATDPLNVLGGLGLLKVARGAKAAKANNLLRESRLATGGMPEEIAKLTKVVDEAGGPQRMYHGTNAVFDKFDMGKMRPANATHGRGVYMTTDPAAANKYARLITKQDAEWLPGGLDEATKRLDEWGVPAEFGDASYFKRLAAENPTKFADEIGVVHPLAFDDLMSTRQTPHPANVRMQYVDARNVLDDAGVSVGDARAAGYDAVRNRSMLAVDDPSQIYSPWIAPAAQRVPRTSPLLAALAGLNAGRSGAYL